MPHDDDMLLAVTRRRLGHTLGAFRLEEVLGVGAVTAVYTGLRADGARAVVRVLHPEVASLPDAVEAFLASGQAANRVGNAGAVRIIESGDDARPFLATALLEGQSLAERVAQRGRMRWPDVLRIADAVLETLTHAHRRDVIHGDLQPHNLRMTPRGLRLLDFTMAPLRRLAAQDGMRAHTAADASAAWLDAPPSEARDLAALGATMAALLSGGPLPGPGELVEIADTVDPALADLMVRALLQGFSSAAEMRVELTAIAARSIAPPPPSLSPQALSATSVPPPPSSSLSPQALTTTSAPPPPTQSKRTSAPPPPALTTTSAPPPPALTTTSAPPVARAPSPEPPLVLLELDLEMPAAALAPPSAPPPSLPRSLPTAPALPPPPTRPPPPASVAPRPIASQPPSARLAQGERARGDVAPARALFVILARCLAGGSAAIVEALAHEAVPAPPGEEEARDAARPEAARLLVRAHEAAAALAASEGSLVFRVVPRGFELHGQLVWQPHGPLERVPARLAASGVRGLGLRRGLMLPEVAELLRIFAAVVEGDPSLDEDLAGVLWEAALPNVFVEADDDPLGPLDGDPGDALRAERDREVTLLRARDGAALEQHHRRGAGRGAAFPALHDRLIDLLTRLPAASGRRSEADAIFGARVAAQMAIPRAEAMHIDAETRALLKADLDADPTLELTRTALAATRGWEAGDAPVAAALRAAVDELSRGDATAALGLVHAACAAIEARAAEPGELSFELAVDLTGAGDGAGASEPEDERRIELARLLVSVEALGRLLTARPSGRAPRHGQTPSTIMAARVRDLLARLGEGSVAAVLDAFPRVVVPEVRWELERALARWGDAVVAPVAALMTAVDVDPAVALVRVLVAIGTRRALDAIGAGVRSPHPLVRIESLSHLEGASSERLRAELKTLLEDPDPDVRLAALRTMTASQIKAAGPHLALMVKADGFDDRSVDERRAMLSTLAALLPSRAEAICLEQVQGGALLPRAAHEETRELAAEVLGEIAATPEVARALVEVADRRLRNTDRTRKAARAAAERITARLRAGEGGAPK